MATKSWVSQKGVVIAAGVVVVLAVIYFGWARSYLGARLAGPDVSTRFTPLVRHLLKSEKHCYDNGSQYCEQLVGSGGGKEFTVAYLFWEKPYHLVATNTVYGCFSNRSRTYYLTLNPKECSSRQMFPYFFGYTGKTDNFESSTELFRCFNRSADNYLVTDDRRECELARHTDEMVSLGWAAAAGHLPQRRLESLCAAVKQAGVLANDYDGYCLNLGSATNTPTPNPRTSTPGPDTPTPPPVKSWQNPRNRFDVNNDASVTPLDLLVLVNSYNGKGVRDLVKVSEPTPPPYIDVNGDKHFTIFDVQIESECVGTKGGKNC